MKNILIIAFTLFGMALFGQDKIEMPEKLKTGIKKGDAQTVAIFFNENIEMSIEGDENIYSSRQAEFVLQKFFRAHKPKSFLINHQGYKNNTSYVIANLQTFEGNFKMIFLLKRTEVTVKIHQLRIENE
ncbi:MAG: hypothetical protein C0599_13275 [Salinivirgaceae bacterium]|nr:MAG: hypothetical protein C0599_13275 [Salinivirgaceae bacterium]